MDWQIQPTKLVRRRGACSRCKRKKARCDGSKPTCIACVRAGNSSCVYESESSASEARSSLSSSSSWIGSQNARSSAAARPAATTPPTRTPLEQDATTVVICDVPSPLLADEFSAGLPASQIGTFRNSIVVQPEQTRQEYQSPYKSPEIDNPRESHVSTDIFSVKHPLVDYPLDVDSSSFSDIFCDTWIFEPPITSPSHESTSYPLQGWLGVAPSRTKALSERLFPVDATVAADITSAASECERARNEYGLDSSIFSTTLRWLDSLPAEIYPPQAPHVGTLVKRLVQKLRHQPIKTPRHVSGETVLGQTPNHVLHTYITTFFNHPLSCYFSVEDVHKWLSLYLNASLSARLAVEPLLNAIFAIGCRSMREKHPNSIAKIDSTAGPKAEDFFAVALAAKGRLLEGEPSVLKLQSLVTLALYLYGSREEELSCFIISNAVQMAVALRLNKSRGIESLAQTEQEACSLRQMFWIIYAIEKPLVMRLNRHSFLEDTSIDYAPQLQPDGCASTQSVDKLLYLLNISHYARVCSMIMKRLYTFPKAQQWSDVAPTIHEVQTLLHEWKECLPEAYKVLPQGFKLTPGLDLHQLQNMVDFTLRYYEAVLVIHQRGQICVQSARSILSLTHLFDCDESNLNWASYRLPIVSSIIVLMNTIEVNTSNEIKENMPYLAIANGWYGRLALSLDWDFGFAELMDLGQIAQGIWKAT